MPEDEGNAQKEVSMLMTTCSVFIALSLINCALLTPLNNWRCWFWDLDAFSRDESWIANWFAQSHFHVMILLACFAFGTKSNVKAELTIGYIVSVIIIAYLVQGVFLLDTLSRPLASLQAIIFVFVLGSISIYSAKLEATQSLIPLPRKLSTSSFSQRKKISIPAVAMWAQFITALFRVYDMTFGNGRSGYLGDMSSDIYQNISNMAVCDMIVSTLLLGVAIRFCEADQLKLILYGQGVALLISQFMLASSQGEMIKPDQVRAGGIGTFISILVALVGAI